MKSGTAARYCNPVKVAQVMISRADKSFIELLSTLENGYLLHERDLVTQGLALLSAFQRIEDQAIKDNIVAFVTSLAKPLPETRPDENDDILS